MKEPKDDDLDIFKGLDLFAPLDEDQKNYNPYGEDFTNPHPIGGKAAEAEVLWEEVNTDPGGHPTVEADPAKPEQEKTNADTSAGLEPPAEKEPESPAETDNEEPHIESKDLYPEMADIDKIPPNQAPGAPPVTGVVSNPSINALLSITLMRPGKTSASEGEKQTPLSPRHHLDYAKENINDSISAFNQIQQMVKKLESATAETTNHRSDLTKKIIDKMKDFNISSNEAKKNLKEAGIPGAENTGNKKLLDLSEKLKKSTDSEKLKENMDHNQDNAFASVKKKLDEFIQSIKELMQKITAKISGKVEGPKPA